MSGTEKAPHSLQEHAAALGEPPVAPRAILDALLDPYLLLEPVRDNTGKISDFIIEEANEAAAQYYRLD
ncbi:MAG: hypothetical protein ACKOD5_06480, partial [Chthoniobacterales bacterium]